MYYDLWSQYIKVRKLFKERKIFKGDKGRNYSRKYGNSICIVNCADSAGKIEYGLYNHSLGNSYNYNSYARKNIFATGKIFGRFYNKVPKNKYCHEFTKGHFSQSSLKKVKNYILLVPATRPKECC